MQKIINSFLKFIKYPIAVCCVFFTYPLFNALILLIRATFDMDLAIYFLLPAVGTAVLWYVIPNLAGAPLTIFAHEATHMLVAILTFHKPTGMTIKEDVGGSLSYRGKGNWLITISPYFLPTFPLIWMLLGLFIGRKEQFDISYTFENWYMMAYGFFVGFHIAANATQIHADQPDFQKAGWPFTIMFIPCANLFVMGYLWCFSLKGWAGFSLWNHYMNDSYHDFIKLLLSQAEHLIQLIR